MHFEKGDMRQPFGYSRFDYILNLFTSSGYFENGQENLLALEMTGKKALKPGGSLVLDFMNADKVRLGLVEEEVRQAEGIKFHIERTIRSGWVIKHIRFECGGRPHLIRRKQAQLSHPSRF
ncbi:MAG: hypothetical protein U5L96_04440 [Owenweeksia sp.]|nr:hypothetical protein [Owenweeksia sp.]